MNRYIRMLKDVLTNIPPLKVLVWCVPLTLLLTAIVLILLFASKDIVIPVLTAIAGVGGGYGLSKIPQ
jgi:hypothetical protein